MGRTTARIRYGMTFGSTVDLIGCVAQPPELRGACLAFVLAGEEDVSFADGGQRQQAFYQRCLIERSHPQAHLVMKGQPLAVAGHIHQTRNSVNRAVRIEVMVEHVTLLTRHATDLILDMGGGVRLRDGHQHVLLFGRAGGEAGRTMVSGTPVLNASIASPHPHRPDPNWLDINYYGAHPNLTVKKGQSVVVSGRLWNRTKVIHTGGRVTFTSVDVHTMTVVPFRGRPSGGVTSTR